MNFSRLRTDLTALVMLAATVFAALSLVSYDPADAPGQNVYPPHEHASNICGIAGAHLAHMLFSVMGLSAYVLVVGLVVLDVRLLARRPFSDPYVRATGFGLILLSLSVTFRTISIGLGNVPAVGSGGYLGAWGYTLLDRRFSTGGTMIFVATGMAAGLILVCDGLILRLMSLLKSGPGKVWGRLNLVSRFSSSKKFANRIAEPFRRRGMETDEDWEEQLENHAAATAVEEEASVEDPFTDEAVEDEEKPRKPIRINPPVSAVGDRDRLMVKLDANADSVEEVALPETSLLENADEFPFEYLSEKARKAAAVLERTFQEFGLNVRVSEIDTGPVITQFELELEKGLRLNKITSLADDLAVALRVPAVRVVAPIPGKNTVGVEVPNDKQVMVRLRELIESSPEQTEKHRIPIFLGKDVSGRPLAVDLTKMPHLLIAGRTGTGKSVCLNTLILSMLMTRSPAEVKMLMIDPKMVELSPYKRVPHLMHPVITDMKKAEAILAWAVDKMEERYDLLARCGVRHLDSYNKLGKEEVLNRIGEDPESEEARNIPEKMPYIVIIADEMADMMMTSGKDVEGHIIRLAQKSRAVGIHLVLATQKPTVDVITGLIKSNLPARISFQVASKTDSRVVLDEMGAERLLGNGDMLYLAPGTSKVTRAQGTFVSDDEVNKIIEFFSDQEPQYSHELAQISTSSGGAAGGIEAMRKRDDLYESAIDVVIREGRGSVSLLQRALGIGYGRGARLIDYMAEDGIVGDYNGSQAREVLYTPEQWRAIVEGVEEDEYAMAE
ncbi:DNA translocase FtsK [Symmachiella dynata]|uniref:DNA translocase FtsK n=1 Tax=Symmachiella dynata TaxID=2527995 RepID=UPI00118846AB|nr:DNA translocase FtsK [Symmachiella dynata]QDT48345.1 DNA translocase FtsK [Symmachiella dynata]